MKNLIEDLKSNVCLRIAAVLAASGLNAFAAIPVIEFIAAGVPDLNIIHILSLFLSVLLTFFPLCFRDQDGNWGWFQSSYESLFSTLFIVGGPAMAMADVATVVIPEIVALYAFSCLAVAVGIVSFIIDDNAHSAEKTN